MCVLLIHFLVACAKPPGAGINKDGINDTSMDATSLPGASVAAGDHPLTNASGETIYPGSGSGSGSGSPEFDANDPLNNPKNLLAKRVIYYPTDVDTISEQDKPLVQAHAEYLVEHPNRAVRLEGNSDERGSSEYNLALGQRRADGVKKRLLMGGVREGQIESISYGEEKPKDKTHDESSWSQNRRTDLNYSSK
ncbi:MAG: peptidoglycan-associated lipoprotein Pal [Pseudomonadota bacterium]|nr:peptidoglycan-associated lipoprotein Pal [Pseudomonadota bacterium]